MTKINPINLQKALKGAGYPATGRQLAQRARENGADDELVKRLEKLPEGDCSGPNDVSRAVFRSED